MKSIVAVALVTALVAAEVPSNSYLPPPPNRGYPQAGSPSIIAARTLDQGHSDHHNGDRQYVDQHSSTDAVGVNGFARSSPQSHEHGAHSHGPQARFSSNEEQGYDHNAAGFGRNGLDDVNATVSYEAEERGYKPQSSYEDSEEGRSGYDSNANNFRANTGYHGNEQDGGSTARSNGYYH